MSFESSIDPPQQRATTDNGVNLNVQQVAVRARSSHGTFPGTMTAATTMPIRAFASRLPK